jgi:zinc transporter ZupT
VSYPTISRIEPSLLGALLSITAGTLIYVVATHLLPHAEKEPAKYSLVALAAGILVAAPRHGRSVRCSHRERSPR